MWLTEKKLNARIQELASYRYRDIQKLDTWQYTEDQAGEIATYPPSDLSASTQIKIGDRWSGRDLYVWLQKEVTIPETWSGQTVVGFFDFGQTGAGGNSGFESLLFMNRKPYQGVDSNHKEVFLPEELIGTKVQFDFRLWSGLEGGGQPQEQHYRFDHAWLAVLDEAVDHFYFDAKAVLETVQALPDTQVEKSKLSQCLNEAFAKIDWLQPGSETFYQSVYEANQYLTEQLANMPKCSEVIFHCVGHTHIDVAWLWRLKHTREKSARSFSTVLRLMEKYPEYLFLQSQPQLYDYIKQDYPQLYQQIKEKIKEDKWEVEGGMWVEADCNIPSGESLVRQLLLGTRFFKEEFGKENEVLWLPDVFGYSWALPQILKKSGFTSFMTTKISWNQYNRMPHDTFQWRGIDGSEILTHFITTTEPWPESTYYTYNGYMEPKITLDSWEAYKDKAINQDLLLAYGYGDGGGGVNREMLEMRRRIDKIPGLPQAKPAKAKGYFQKLRDKIAATDQYVHTWDGELYLEFHRGTYTSQAFMKKMNRKLELLYRESEWLNSWASIINPTAVYPSEELIDGWKIILRNQFHDIIPGSSIKEVYEDAAIEYKEAESIVQRTTDQALKALAVTETDHVFLVFNAASWQRDDVAFVPHQTDGIWSDHQGRHLEAQKTDGGSLVHVPAIPALGYKTIYFEPGKQQAAESVFQHQANGVVTPFYEITWNAQGQLTRIFDRKANREVLEAGKVGNDLQIFEDKPLMFDAWDIDIFYQEKMEHVDQVELIEQEADGALYTKIRFQWSYGSSTISQDMILYADQPRIDFKTTVDWQERQRLLKVAFPVEIRATEATYDIQYGNVKRPTHWNTSWDYARFESVGHKWADLQEPGYGVSLLNDSKYGYDIKDNVLRLSLLKSPTYPDPEGDRGEHHFTYSLLPHQGDWREANVPQQAHYLNQPLRVAAGELATVEQSLIASNTDYIEIDAVKQAEDGQEIIVRLHEFHGRRGQVTLTSDFDIASWQICDLMERREGEPQTGEIVFDIDPYEIKTIAIAFKEDV
ncbi:alpha-mannosidase [Gracilibacillus alcaliphilus]|uniref:alpha-mannosidase n=1 Tax=Gracilibacillus alcaliphilus TaxID=1401441 RepID=UPI00195BD048|nr:alpha-mannosidase [Gracilibacillus alcaliphilus]MBM7676287.1 alpha-mannosidase [Gracilibacillus alcaliphilus]